MLKLRLNSNTSTPWMLSKADALVMGVDSGTWSGGTLTLEKLKDGAAVPIKRRKAPIAYVDDFMERFDIGPGVVFRWTMTSASNPDVEVELPHELVSYNQ